MTRSVWLAGIICFLFISCAEKKEVPPNIILIYADDLGFGDIGVNGAKGVNTPNIDRLAKEGVNFTDAHSSAATCTPSRYSLLTGSYAFRNNAAVLSGDAPLIIDTDMETLPSMLQKAGYRTGVVGKWHLGLGNGEVDWSKRISPGPKEIGFDYSFLIPATGDRVPCIFVEDQQVVGLDPDDPIEVSYDNEIGGYPLGSEHPELLKVHPSSGHDQAIINGISRIGYMKGGEMALWKDEDFPFILTDKAKKFIGQQRDAPFFLYWAFHDIHVPRVPHERFVGQSTMGPRGDAIAQMDWCVGQIIEYVEELGLSENTLIIFTSDNGPVLDDGYVDQAKELLGDHQPAGPFSGGKYSMLEAGTRMPTITHWPGTIEPGISSALLSQVDLLASIAKLVNVKVDPTMAPDSEDHLDAWLGKTNKGREYMLEEGFSFALRMGDWKYIEPMSGKPKSWLKNKGVRTGLINEPQLYHLAEDTSEIKNLSLQYPDKLETMRKKLKVLMK